MPAPLIIPVTRFPFNLNGFWSAFMTRYGELPAWGIRTSLFVGQSQFAAHSLAPQGFSASDNFDGTATVTMTQRVWDGMALGAVEEGDGAVYFPDPWTTHLKGGIIPVLGISLGGSTRDDNFGVSLVINFFASAVPYITHTVIDWGDGTEILPGKVTARFRQYDGPASGAISVSAIMSQDYPQLKATIAFAPEALFEIVSADQCRVEVDASDSWDLEGGIAEYEWQIIGPTSPITQEGSGAQVAFLNCWRPGVYTIRLRVRDGEGTWSDQISHSFVIGSPGAAAIDVHGRIWATSPSNTSTGAPGDKLRCYWHPQDMSKFDEAPVGMGEESVAPTALWFDSAGRLWGLFYGGSLGYNFGEFSSYNDGENEIQQFVFSGGAIVLAGDIHGADGCALAEGGMAVCGVDCETGEIKFRISYDGNGASWEDEVIVATLTDTFSFDLALFQFSGVGSSLLTILHINSGKRWTSLNYGSSWTAAT